jgi:hypothetical protein
MRTDFAIAFAFLFGVGLATVHLRTESFDTSSNVGQELNIRRHFLTANAASRSDTDKDIFIAHMNPKLGTPWSENQIQSVAEHTGRLLHVPQHSFLFYGTPHDAFKMESLPIVDWVGRLHPRHRKSPIAYPQAYSPDKPCLADPEVDSNGNVVVHELVIMTFPMTPETTKEHARVLFDKWLTELKENEKQIKEVDFEFKFWMHDRYTLRTKSSCMLCVFDSVTQIQHLGLAASAVEYLSLQPEVLDLERTLSYEPMMKFLKPLVINGIEVPADVDAFIANSSQLLHEFWGLTGSSQVVGIADTGITREHCYLYLRFLHFEPS